MSRGPIRHEPTEAPAVRPTFMTFMMSSNFLAGAGDQQQIGERAQFHDVKASADTDSLTGQRN
jgi:hypothetical protein